MKEQNQFKISEELKEYIRNILVREGISYRFKKENEQFYCLTHLSGERFHKVVKRARCEKMSKETGILHLTYHESQDDEMANALMMLFNETSYVVASVPHN